MAEASMGNPIQEFRPFTDLLSSVPRKIQKGLFKTSLKWTCVDATAQYVAIGTDAGFVSLYDRELRKTSRLSCPSSEQQVSCIKMINSVDYLVAVGTADGLVYVYQLPSIIPGRNKEMLTYIVNGQHNFRVCSLEWSLNAMKLYSGDDGGTVSCSEIDYNENRIQTYTLLKEDHPVVQLSYMHRCLLVSTKSRSVICNMNSTSQDIIQLGVKERKSLGDFGAVFLPGVLLPKDAVIFASRPGFRLWKASIDGKVQATYLYRDLLNSEKQGIEIHQNTRAPANNKVTEQSFGPLYIFEDTLLVTYDAKGVYVLDPGLGTFVGYHRNIGPIRNIAVSIDEIFVLQSDSYNIFRLSRNPSTVDSGERPSPTANEALTQSKTKGLKKMPKDLKSPVDILSTTANSMTDNIIGVFKGVSKSAQDGERYPPWGLPGTSDDQASARLTKEDSVDSAKEASPTDIPSPIVEDSASSSLEEADANYNPPGAPPIVQLYDKSLTALRIETGSSNHQEKKHNIGERFTKVGQESQADDIVYTSGKVRKKKKKNTSAAKEKDSVSIASQDSLEGGITVVKRSDNHTSSLSSPSVSPRIKHKSRFSVEQVKEKLTSDTDPTGSYVQGKDVIHGEFQYVNDLTSAKTRPRTSQPEVVGPVLKKQDIQNFNSTKEDFNPDLSEAKTKIPLLVSYEIDEMPPTGHCLDMTATTTSSKTLCAQSQKNKILNEDENTEDLVKKSDAILSPVSESSVEDFYSKYKSDSYTSPSDVSPVDTDEPSIQEMIDGSDSIEPNKNSFPSSLREKKFIEQPETLKTALLADSWTEFSAPGNLKDMCLSSRHIWCCDQNENIYYSSLHGTGLVWNKVPHHQGSQISVSLSGWLIWRLHKGSVYAATNVSPRMPHGKEWMEIARNVNHICVDETVAWYAKSSGEVVMQKNLSKDRPNYRPIKIICPMQTKVMKIVCKRNVVWALTEDYTIIIRTGVTEDCQEGLDWKFLQGTGPGFLVASFDIGNNDTAWAIDLVGRTWFTSGVTKERPEGSGKWFQVSLSDHLMQDAVAEEVLKTLLIIPQTLTRLASGEKGAGLVRVSSDGVWLCPGYKNTIHVCRGNVTGYQWELVVPSGMVSSTKWLHVSGGCVRNQSGMIWTQQPSHSLFCLPNTWKSGRVIEVSPPDCEKDFISMSATQGAVWGLHSNGEVYVRAGISSHLPQGLRWESLDLTQLGKARFVDISCGSETIWAVDQKGMVYFRLGVAAPSPGHLNPAWVPLPDTSQEAGTKFTKVCSGFNDWMVWVLDNKKCAYARMGISDSMPIGTHWLPISGLKLVDMCVGSHSVQAVTDDGEIYCRYGISEENITGNYWRKLPGVVATVSATSVDDLWAISRQGQLLKRFKETIKRNNSEELTGATKQSSSIEEGDWELI